MLSDAETTPTAAMHKYLESIARCKAVPPVTHGAAGLLLSDSCFYSLYEVFPIAYEAAGFGAVDGPGSAGPFWDTARIRSSHSLRRDVARSGEVVGTLPRRRRPALGKGRGYCMTCEPPGPT